MRRNRLTADRDCEMKTKLTPTVALLITLLLTPPAALRAADAAGKAAASPRLTAAPPARPVALNAADYPSLQAAVDALPKTGGTILLPPGEFKLQKTLNVTFAARNYPQFGVQLKGAGRSATMLLLDTKLQPGLDFTGNSYWKVSDLHIRNRSADVGALLARTPANGRGCCGEFDNVVFDGSYPVAAVYMTASECCRFWNCTIGNQLKKWYNKDVEGWTEGEAAVMISPGNIRHLQSPYCQEGTGGGSNTEYLFDGCTIGSEPPQSCGLKIFGQASDIRITSSYLHSCGLAAIYLDGTRGNLNNVSLRNLRIEAEKAQHALSAVGHTSLVTIEGGNWSSTKEAILQEGAPVAFTDAGGACTSTVGAANKWKISQLGLSIWDGWGYRGDYSTFCKEQWGTPEKTAWRDGEPHVFMRFNQLLNSVVEPCEMITRRWRPDSFRSESDAGKLMQTVGGLSVEQARQVSEASFMGGEANRKLRQAQCQLAIGKGSAGNRITVVSQKHLDVDKDGTAPELHYRAAGKRHDALSCPLVGRVASADSLIVRCGARCQRWGRKRCHTPPSTKASMYEH